MISHTVFIAATWIAAICGALAVGATLVSAIVGYQLAENSVAEANERIAASQAETAKAHERIADLNNQTERLKADNLSVQKAMLPRRLAVIRMDRPMGDIGPTELGIPPDAAAMFSDIQKHRAPVWIQAVPEYEPEMFALDLKTALEENGVKVQLVDQSLTHNPPTQIPQGVRVFTVGTPTSPGDLEHGFGFKPGPQHGAAMVIAGALTNAGFGTAGYGIGPSLLADRQSNGKLPFFDPRFDGVLVQIGRKPLTVELYKLMKSGK
jgi:uncharacterized small protein (DUF1192 family)